MAIYQVRKGFFLHKKEGKVNRVYQAGELVELIESEYDLYAHQVEPPTEKIDVSPAKKPTKEVA